MCLALEGQCSLFRHNLSRYFCTEILLFCKCFCFSIQCGCLKPSAVLQLGWVRVSFSFWASFLPLLGPWKGMLLHVSIDKMLSNETVKFEAWITIQLGCPNTTVNYICVCVYICMYIYIYDIFIECAEYFTFGSWFHNYSVISILQMDS